MEEREITCSCCQSTFLESDTVIFEEASVCPTMGKREAKEVITAKCCPVCGFTCQITTDRILL